MVIKKKSNEPGQATLIKKVTLQIYTVRLHRCAIYFNRIYTLHVEKKCSYTYSFGTLPLFIFSVLSPPPPPWSAAPCLFVCIYLVAPLSDSVLLFIFPPAVLELCQVWIVFPRKFPFRLLYFSQAAGNLPGMV